MPEFAIKSFSRGRNVRGEACWADVIFTREKLDKPVVFHEKVFVNAVRKDAL